jgi:hypothetical protein
VRAPRLRAAGPAALATAALVACAVAALPAAARTTASTPALTVRAWIQPQPARFGEHVQARVEVLADSRRVQPGSVVVVPGLAPLVVLGSQRASEGAAGVARVVVRLEAVCDADACLPLKGARQVRPGAVLVRARGRDGAALTARATWPALRVVTRLTAADLGPAEPPFRVPSQALAPTFRVAPHRLEVVLFAVAALLAVTALALVGSALSRRRRRERQPAPLTVADAIAAVRAAAAESTPRRREALERLARMLGPAADDGPGATARALAWGRPAPAPEAMEAVAAAAEQSENGA